MICGYSIDNNHVSLFEAIGMKKRDRAVEYSYIVCIKHPILKNNLELWWSLNFVNKMLVVRSHVGTGWITVWIVVW